MWIYEQATGRMLHDDEFIWNGYSGKGQYKNDPSSQNIPKEGVIPCGVYTMGKPENFHEKLGPYAIPLYPDPSNEMFGRADFFIHGDDAEHDASEGCIIKSPKSARQLLGESPDRILKVV